jgi:hypothetical protein
MTSFAEKLFAEIQKTPGQSDRELTDALCGPDKHPSQVNQEARLLESTNRIVRRSRVDGVIGNYPEGAVPNIAKPVKPEIARTPEGLSEDELKESLDRWLQSQDWTTQIAWRKS